MTRPIDADAFKKQFSGEEHYWALKIIDMIDNAPTVPLPDFKEGYKQAILDGKTNFSRPKGKWVESDVPESILSKCSLCGFHCGAKTFNFCPMCGADMRGDKEWK